MPNYGDIRLNLPPTWNRQEIFNQEFVNSTIGHRDGVSEVRLAKEPDKLHAFAWADPREVNGVCDVDRNVDDGYAFVKKDDGWIADRWHWDAEGRLRCEGQLLMYISADEWAKLEARREKRAQVGIPSDPADVRLQEDATRLRGEVIIEDKPRRQARRGF